MTEAIANSIGDRITYCRSALYLTRKELASEWKGASVPTISRWELDVIDIPYKKLDTLIKFFQKKGLVVTKEWIIRGVGAPPVLLSDEHFDDLDFDSLAQEELLTLNKKIKNFIFGKITNNFMSPIVKYGDYIGGVNSINEIDFMRFFGELIFVREITTDLFIGILFDYKKDIIIKSYNSEKKIIKTSNLNAIGKVQWIIKRT